MKETTTTRYAGFWIRTVAAIVDLTLLSIAAWIAQLALLGLWYWIAVVAGAQSSAISFDDAFNPLLVQVLNSLIYLALSAPYFVIGHARYRTTLGKRLVRVYVVDHRTFDTITNKQSWIRFAASGLSYLPLCGGYLMVAFHPEKRALHDLIAGTISVRVAR
jgi:uncharacterized RDD family membrane protein YckC